MDEETKKRFEEIEKRLNVLENKRQILPCLDNSSKKKSVKEFILEKSPKDDVQNTTCIAYYLENFENKKILTSKEIQKCFKDAKLKTPLNVPDKVQKAIGRGWMAKGDKTGEFYLTSSGEDIVKNNFNKNDKQ
jgi:hypothetical protein